MMVRLLVAASLAAGDEIEDIRPPIPPDHSLQYLMLLAVLLLATVLAYLWWPSPKPRPLAAPSHQEEARARLQMLAAQSAQLDAHQFAIEISAVLRQYVERQYGVAATRQTTPEFQVGECPLLGLERRALFERFLLRCDALKFAPVHPAPDRTDFLAEANRLVEEKP